MQYTIFNYSYHANMYITSPGFMCFITGSLYFLTTFTISPTLHSSLLVFQISKVFKKHNAFSTSKMLTKKFQGLNNDFYINYFANIFTYQNKDTPME